ncbi:hypothetical protein [Saccharicrinis sp. FJH54]|uniref:hypothetical protein n=1 Tax=Saccharicrinis sp. FJH54 TaxID=3344665 RepID=UPI0035D3E124
MTTIEIASELNRNNWYQKKDGSPIEPFQIHGRTRNYPKLFGRNGSTVFLADKSPGFKKADQTFTKNKTKLSTSRNKDSDEKYIIDLCDQALELKASRQHKFDFLKGDPNSQGRSVLLPVDAYYEELSLVVEYREKQHTEQVQFFDKPNKMTVSGVNRGEQRKIYDQRRREVLPKNGIQLIEISYDDFNHDGQKRIIRDKKRDLDIIKQKIKNGS